MRKPGDCRDLGALRSIRDRQRHAGGQGSGAERTEQRDPVPADRVAAHERELQRRTAVPACGGGEVPNPGGPEAVVMFVTDRLPLRAGARVERQPKEPWWQHGRERVGEGQGGGHARRNVGAVGGQAPEIVASRLERQEPERAVGGDIGGDGRAQNRCEPRHRAERVDTLEIRDARRFGCGDDGAAVGGPRRIVPRDAVVGIGVAYGAVGRRDANHSPAIAGLLAGNDLSGAGRHPWPVEVARHAARAQDPKPARREIDAHEVAPPMRATNGCGPGTVRRGVCVAHAGAARHTPEVPVLGTPDERSGRMLPSRCGSRRVTSRWRLSPSQRGVSYGAPSVVTSVITAFFGGG
jgi:hypothetical protein